MPSVGLLTDRIGVRRVVLPAIVISALALCLVVLSKQLWHFYAAIILFSLVGSTTTSLPYVRVIAMWFDRRRGLMLGIVAAGIGVGFAVMPVVMQALLQAFGWRGAYIGVAALLAVVIFPILFLLLRDSPAEFGLLPDNRRAAVTAAAREPPSGLALKEAFRTSAFWLLLVITFVFAFVFNGMAVHLIPLLKDKGMVPTDAVFMASMMGVSLFASRILIGLLLDVFFAPRLAIVTFALGALGLLLAALSSNYGLNLVGAMLIGVGIGAETDIVSYMASRYFGLQSFGKIYGAIFAFFYLGTGLGPLALGIAFEAQGSYTSILIVYAVMCLAIAMTFLFFGPYRYRKVT
jgi:MFS family permease